MYAGKIDGEMEFLYAVNDDAWERDSRIMFMLNQLRATVAGLVGTKVDARNPDYFNDSLKVPDSAGNDDDDYPWLEVDTENNGHGNAASN